MKVTFQWIPVPNINDPEFKEKIQVYYESKMPGDYNTPRHVLSEIQSQAFDAFLSSPCECDSIVFVKHIYNHVDDYILYYGATK